METDETTRVLFHWFLFCPKNPLDVAREAPILLNKLLKYDAQWSTKKTVLGWAIDISQNIFMLPSTCREKLVYSLSAIPNQARRVIKKKYYRLLGIFCSAVPSIVGADGMFRRLQHALKTA